MSTNFLPPPPPQKPTDIHGHTLKNVPLKKSSREDTAHCGAKQIGYWQTEEGTKNSFHFNLISPAPVTQLSAKRNLTACSFPREGREKV